MILTTGQRKALLFLRDDDEYGDMVYEKGIGWWFGTRKTSGRLALGLIQLCLVSADQYTSLNDGYQRWEINECGIRALDNQPPYRLSDGEYSDSLYNRGARK